MDGNSKDKLTLPTKSTLTLKSLGDRANSADGSKKVVQVEVRKRRSLGSQVGSLESNVKIDDAMAAKLKLIAESKEHEAKRKVEEAEREKTRQEERELEEKQKAEEKKALEERAQVSANEIIDVDVDVPVATDKSAKIKDKKSKDFDDDEDFEDKKFKKDSPVSAAATKEDVFEQERKKVMKRTFEPQRRNAAKVNVNFVPGSSDDEEEDYGFGSRRRFKRKKPKVVEIVAPEKVIKEVVIPEVIGVQELANRMAEKGAVVIKKLMDLGVMATINQVIDADTAQIVVEELGHKFKRVSDADVEEGLSGVDDIDDNLLPRAPVVTVMGHVDHGKTSLLDALRETQVASREAGGITQHIGAYQIITEGGEKITFIDTPGHEAFSEMRARGAKVTDIVILVVAANDGIMPQTVEAIRHAQAAEVPIVVAINKIDLPNVDPQKIKLELLQHGIAVEEMGGECLSVEVSAKKRININGLLDAVLLQAEMLNLKANPNRKAQGVVVEAKMEKGRGSVATALVQKGTLNIGDIFIAGKEWGRVRAMFNEHGKKMLTALPSCPVEVIGLQGTPSAGDSFIVVDSEEQAKEVTDYRIRKERDAKIVKSAKSAMDQMLDKIKSGESKNLPVIIKADVQGSIEALVGTLNKLSTDEVAVQVLHAAVGPISESDITLAKASNAFVIGFNVRANPQARDMAKRDAVDIRYYSIIYDVANDVKKGLEGMLSPELREKIIGYAEIRKVFNITGTGKVAGCMVTEGVVKRGAKVRLLRDNIVIHDGTLGQLKRAKDDVKEVKFGYECGMSFEHYNDIQEKDFIECYEVEELERQL